ncbi:hypothetical protein D3C80_2053310 [compost metagenome]
MIEAGRTLMKCNDIILTEGNILHMLEHLLRKGFLGISGTIGDCQPLKRPLLVGRDVPLQFAGQFAVMILKLLGYLTMKGLNS